MSWDQERRGTINRCFGVCVSLLAVVYLTVSALAASMGRAADNYVLEGITIPDRVAAGVDYAVVLNYRYLGNADDENKDLSNSYKGIEVCWDMECFVFGASLKRISPGKLQIMLKTNNPWNYLLSATLLFRDGS